MMRETIARSMTILYPVPLTRAGGRFDPGLGNLGLYIVSLFFSYMVSYVLFGSLLLLDRSFTVRLIVHVFSFLLLGATAVIVSLRLVDGRESTRYPRMFEPFPLTEKEVFLFLFNAVLVSLATAISGLALGGIAYVLSVKINSSMTYRTAFSLLFLYVIAGSTLWLWSFESMVRSRLEEIDKRENRSSELAKMNSYDEAEAFMIAPKKYKFDWDGEVPPRTCSSCGSVYALNLPRCPICGEVNDLYEEYMGQSVSSPDRLAADNEEISDFSSSASLEEE